MIADSARPDGLILPSEPLDSPRKPVNWAKTRSKNRDCSYTSRRQKTRFPTGLRVKILSALWGLAIDSVDEQVRNITLRAHSQCLGDIVAYCEVLDLFEAALATFY